MTSAGMTSWRGAPSTQMAAAPPAATGSVAVVSTTIGDGAGSLRVAQVGGATWAANSQCLDCTATALHLPLHWSSRPELSVFVVARIAPGSPVRRIVASRDNDWSLFTRAGRIDTIHDGVTGAVESGTDVTTATPPLSQDELPYGWTIWSGVLGATAAQFGNSDGSAVNAIFRNGTLKRSTPMYVAQGPSTLALGGVTGSNPAGEFTSLQIAEVIVLNRAATETERQRVEGYFAQKFGLQSSLPVGHPYKNGQVSIENANTASATPSPSPVYPAPGPCPVNWTRPAGSTSCYRNVYLGAPGFQQDYAQSFCGTLAALAGYSSGGLASVRSYEEGDYVIGQRCGGYPAGSPTMFWLGPTDSDVISDVLPQMWTGLAHRGSSAPLGNADSAWTWVNGAPTDYILGNDAAAPEWWWPGEPSNSGQCTAVTLGSRNRPRPRLHETSCDGSIRYACCEIIGAGPRVIAAPPSATSTPAPQYGSVGELLPSTPVTGTTGVATYRVYRFVVPVDGDVTLRISPRSATGYVNPACQVTYYWSSTYFEWYCAAPEVQIFNKPVSGPGAGYNWQIAASNTGASTTIYRAAARSELYIVVVGRSDNAVGYELTASVAVAEESAHNLPNAPTASPLPSASPYALAPMDFPSPDPFFNVMDLSASTFPIARAYRLGGGLGGGGRYHYFAINSPVDGGNFKVTLVPAPGTRLALSISRGAPSGFQNVDFSPFETAPASYWSPQSVFMLGMRSDYAANSTYWVRVKNNGDDVAAYSLLVDPFPTLPTPGSILPLTASGLPSFVYFDSDSQTSTFIFRAPSPGRLSLRFVPASIQLRYNYVYIYPQWDVRSLVGTSTSYIKGASTCCDGREVADFADVPAGDIIISGHYGV